MEPVKSYASEAPEDSRILPIRQHIAGNKIICPYGVESEEAQKIQFSVAPNDLHFTGFCDIVEKFYAEKMNALIVLAPEGFHIQPGETNRATEMAEKMNEMLWLAFKRHSAQGKEKHHWNENDFRPSLEAAWKHARANDIALQPQDSETAFNIQAMGPFYRDQKHFRYAPGDLFLLLVRMSDIEKLQRAASQAARIKKIRDDAFASTKGLVDFMALVVPETLDELPPDRRKFVQFEHALRDSGLPKIDLGQK